MERPGTRTGTLRSGRASLLLGVLLVGVGTVALGQSVRSGGDVAATEVLGAVAERPAPPPGEGGAVTVVRVRARTCAGPQTGSGVVLAGGRVLTAGHVVAGADQAVVDGPFGTVAVAVAAFDPHGRDAAVLAARDGADVTGLAAPAVATAVAAVDEPVVVIGHAGGGPLTRTAGTVLGFTTNPPMSIDGGQVMTVDIAFAPGVSGGAVLDSDGRLVAIAEGVERNSATGIAIPTADLADLLAGRGAPPPGCPQGG